MPDKEILYLLEHIERERGLSEEALLESIREALLSAYKKKYDQVPRELKVLLDQDDGKLKVLAKKKVVKKVRNEGVEVSLAEAEKIGEGVKLGDEVEVKISPLEFTRIAASTGKYVMMQQIVETEKDQLYEEFKKRESEIISGTVRYRTNRFILIDLGKVEGILPRREQLSGRRYRQGERLRAYVLQVTREPKGPRIILSQTHPAFLYRLFELEVPEIGEGIVEIVQIKRDPGRRAKVVVNSKDEKVDPVGACVGLRGSRIKAILRELEGERIDIIRYDEVPATFIKNSLKPAEVKQVRIDEVRKEAKVIVSDDQLSLAIGANGENVKLAAKLTGWQIDIRSLGQMDRETTFLQQLPGIGEKIVNALRQAGFISVKDIIRGGVEGLSRVTGVGEKTAQRILDGAKEVGE